MSALELYLISLNISLIDLNLFVVINSKTFCIIYVFSKSAFTR